MDIFAQIALKIIKEQENIIGPVAVELAKGVPGIKLNWDKREVLIDGNETQAIEKLIETYQHLFGVASVEICKEAVRSLVSEIPKDKVPNILQ